MNKNYIILMSRVLGMIFIVLCHIISYYKFIPGNGFLNQFFACGVYLFIFISGYLFGEKTIQNYKQWFFKRIKTVFFPTFIITVLVISCLIICGEKISFSSIIAYILGGEGLLFIKGDFFSKVFQEIPSLGHLWFVTVILICYLLVPLLQEITCKISNISSFAIVFTVVGLVLSFFLNKYFRIIYFVIFAIGYFCGKNNILKKINWKSFAVFSLGFILSLVGRIFLKKLNASNDIYSSYCCFSNPVSGVFFVFLFAFISNTKSHVFQRISSMRFVEILDKYSFSVYLSHYVFCYGLFNVYNHFSLFPATIVFMVCTVLTSVVLNKSTELLKKLI